MDTNYQIFICYRRDGGESLAALLFERFRQRGYRVFYDVESLRSGQFNVKLLHVIEECRDVLVVLPPGGLDRCNEDPGDWVRLEIEHALKLKKNVIPLMMRNFVFPDQLPDSMSELPRLNGISANMEFFDAVIDRIADRLLISRPQEEVDDGKVRIGQLKAAADSGDAAACNEYGAMCEQGSVTLVQNLKTACEYYTKGAESGSSAAMYNLGEVCDACAGDLTLISEYGLHIEQTQDADVCRKELHNRALSCFRQAAEKEYAPALCRMGSIMEELGQPEEAFSFYSRAAALQYLPAVNALAWMYRNGVGTHPDPMRAQELYRRAMEGGYLPAAYNYARVIESWDPEAAMTLYKKAAFCEDAIPEAAYALGRQYENTLLDMRNAIECYERALDGGILQAEDDIDRCKGVTG